MEKEFEIKINKATKDAVKTTFRTQKGDLELRLPLNDGSFDFKLVQDISNHFSNTAHSMFRDTNVFIESIAVIIEDRLHKELELQADTRPDLEKIMKAVHGDIEKGFNSQISKHHKKQKGQRFSM
ncbi:MULTISPECIES: hypothetical protein [Halomonas]|uniref:hypothetical protein n=1 Tax=Halomonas TaxID=2745 RepID=UPI000A289652|nr:MULTISPECIES: hypothetical protein [Halomonas]